jgi:glycosyltransferase involved in cell wall biosynthesis
MITLIQPNAYMLAGMTAATVYIGDMLVELGYDIQILTRDRSKRTNTLTHYGDDIERYYSIQHKPKIVEMEYEPVYGAMADNYSTEFLEMLNSSELVISFAEGLALLPSIANLRVPFWQYYHFPSKNMPPSKEALVVCNSQFTAKAVTEYYGVSPSVVYPIPSGELYYSEPERDIDVLWVGRLSTDKGIKLLTTVAHRRWRVLVVGSHWWEEYSPKKTDLKGLTIIEDTSAHDLRSYYSRAKVVLSTKGYKETDPNKFEHFGITIIEAAYSGAIPLVHNSGGPYTDFLLQEQGGYGYYYTNESGMVYLIDRLISKPPEGIQRRALERAQSLYRYSVASLGKLLFGSQFR